MRKPVRYTKKLIAPLIITLLAVLQASCLFFIWWAAMIPRAAKIILSVVALLVVGVLIFVLVERIREIRSGVEDDLSNY